MTRVHPTAVVDARARLADNVEVGPYAVVGADVELGSGTVVGAHAQVQGPSTLGESNRIFPHAAVGLEPQDLKYRGEPTRLVSGARNVFREFCTVHRGTVGGGGQTLIGDDGFFMAYSHVAHDCQIGDEVIMTGFAALTGFVQVGDRAVISGMTGIHQYVRIGTLAMVAGCSRVPQDVPPYFMVEGNPPSVRGVNIVGLRRAGVSSETRLNLQRAFKIIYRSSRTPTAAVAQIRTEIEASPEIEHLCAFIESSKRGIC